MDLDTITDELYGLRPDRFTAARNARAAEARKDGDRALANAVRALRRPTLAAWVSNLLVRERPDETTSLAALGEGLRRAHHELDGERLRELSRKQHVLVAALARQARQLAADAGQEVGEDVQHEVEATLHAVLADPAAAEEWATGRLVRPLSAPVGFAAALTDVPPRTHTPSPARGKAAEGSGQPPRKRESEGKRESERRAAALREKLREELRHAEEEADRREEERDRAVAAGERAEDESREAARRVERLSGELKEAEQARRTADEAVRTARREVRDAERAARDARRRARDVAARTEREAAGE
ncbi:hypothetical protein [Streptomyces sp. NPDC015131]|uniref:hypothetical protein n=1 Tax=Streptomyces sp. NPDC015131 TaxID=3364941 RepID=UPI0036F862A6